MMITQQHYQIIESLRIQAVLGQGFQTFWIDSDSGGHN